jgi:antitoxin component YwqK of YwqJK toxin-antitoxin module
MRIIKFFLNAAFFLIYVTLKMQAQSTETLYFDEKWKGVASKEEASFYRIVHYDSQGNPKGEILDYYITGELQARVESAKFINRFDDSKSIFIGKSTNYYKSGKVEFSSTHNQDGKYIGDYLTYYESGKLKAKSIFDSSGERVSFKSYYENGQLAQDFPYSEGKVNGTVIYYSETGTITAEIEFSNDKPKYDWCLRFDEQGNSQKCDIKTGKPYDKKNSNENNSISYYLTLTTDGKLREEAGPNGRIISTIPRSTKIGVYSKNDGYYKIDYNGTPGYLSELYFDPNNTNATNTTNTVNASNPTENQRKECKSFYKDGNTFQYYVYKGISVTMGLTLERQYGKYYVAFIAIENFTGNAFNFDPNYIKASFLKNENLEDGEVLSSAEYLKIVNRRQAWNAAFMAFGEASAANQAGYSSSSSTSNTSMYANSYGSASGYYGNNYVSLYGNSTSYGTSTTTTNTQSYNGAANYAAQQNAQNNINNFQSQQFQIKQVLNQGYLKINTIGNQERIVGQINIKYKNSNKIMIVVPVNGENYKFTWSN